MNIALLMIRTSDPSVAMYPPAMVSDGALGSELLTRVGSVRRRERQNAGRRCVDPGLVEDAPQAGIDEVRIGVQSSEAGDDMLLEPAPAVVVARDPRPGSRRQGVRHAFGERVEVEGAEVRHL